MPRFRIFLFIFALAQSAVTFTTAQTPSVWSPEVQVKTKALTTPRISPDGKLIVYAVSDAVMTADKSEFVSQLYLSNTDGSNTRQITFGDKSSTNAKWSPDGSSLIFLSNRKDSKNNLYLLRLGGGEAEPLTDVKGSISDFEWSPDGTWIAYTMADPKSEDEEKNDKGRNDFRWVNENLKMSRLYVMPLAKDANGKREAKKLTTENYNVNGMDWSPDGKTIAFSFVKTSGADDWTTSNVSTVEAASGKITPVAATAASEGSPIYSPDGKWIAVQVSDNPPRWAQSWVINLFPAPGGAAGGAPKALAATFDGAPVVIGFSPDGKKLFFSEAKGTLTPIYSLDIAANKISEISKVAAGVMGAAGINRDGTMMSLVMQTADKAPEVYVSRMDNFAPVRITNVNADMEKLTVGKTEVIKWKSSDGREIEGLLTYPVGYKAGTKVPLLLNIHGGPAGVFQQSYIGGRGSYPIATFASRGYAVLRPNPRGSSGYGVEFRRANHKNWGIGDMPDFMLGVDEVIKMGVADPDRLGVMGWSYGGYMTSFLVTQTNRFKAASAGAPVTNLMSFNGTADIPSFLPSYFDGQHWENMDVYMKHSAMFNIKNVVTPTMIQHGEADVRVPISQGYEFYNALRVKGVPTRMIVLPRQPHGPNEPKMQIAAMQSNLDWFDKYLK